jgi:Domain of unknown function (DUF4432)
VYAHSLTADADGLVRARLVDDRLGLAFELEYDQRQFPPFFQWLHLREGAYAVGFEPSTHPVTGDQAARDDGTMTWLAAGSPGPTRPRSASSTRALAGSGPCRRSRLGLTPPSG